MKPKHKFLSADRTHIYHVAVIYYLQHWHCGKAVENFSKGVIMRKDRNGLSAVDPEKYNGRFVDFMEKFVILENG